MYCIYCGAKIDDDAKFCTECGKKQLQDTPVVEEKASTVSSQASLVSKVLAELHDSDIVAASTKGEMRCPSSAAQTAFMRLIAKGILTLLCLFLLPFDAFAQNTISDQVGGIEVTITFEGGPIKWYLNHKSDEKRKFYAYGMKLHKGDKLTVRATVQCTSNDDWEFLYNVPPAFSSRIDNGTTSYRFNEFISTEDEYGDVEKYRNSGFYKTGLIYTVLKEPKDSNYSFNISLFVPDPSRPDPSGLEKQYAIYDLCITGKKGPNGECQDDAVTELSETEDGAASRWVLPAMAWSV